MTLHTNISLTMALFLSFLKMQPVNSPLLTSNWPLLLASNLNPDPVLCRNQKKVGEDLEFSPELNSYTNKNTFQLKLCVSQLSSSSCCGACTSATPCALYPLPSTNRAIWRRPSTTSSSAPPSSTSSGWSRAFYLVICQKQERLVSKCMLVCVIRIVTSCVLPLSASVGCCKINLIGGVI